MLIMSFDKLWKFKFWKGNKIKKQCENVFLEDLAETLQFFRENTVGTSC